LDCETYDATAQQVVVAVPKLVMIEERQLTCETDHAEEEEQAADEAL